MIAIIVVAHGNLAEALLQAAEGILGEQSDAQAVGLSVGESPQAYAERLGASLSASMWCAGILILADLWGGTPHNAAATLCTKSEGTADRLLVAGANLPMLLEALLGRETERSLSALGRRVMQAGQGQIRSRPDCAGCSDGF